MQNPDVELSIRNSRLFIALHENESKLHRVVKWKIQNEECTKNPEKWELEGGLLPIMSAHKCQMLKFESKRLVTADKGNRPFRQLKKETGESGLFW